MSDEQWLREGLAGAVPEPPPNPQRASASVERARRARRRRAFAAAGAAVAVATVAVLPTLAGDERAPSGPADNPSVSPTSAPACPPAPRPSSSDGFEVPRPDAVDRPDPGAPGAVPEGATSVRLCQGPGTIAFDAPADALVTDVDRLIDTANGLHEVSGDLGDCGPDLGIGYRLSFGYPDGGRFVVSGRLYDCRTVAVGSSERLDADELWEQFIDQLREQRAGLEPEAEPAADGPLCSDRLPTSPVAHPEDLAVAVLCVDGAGARVRQVEVPEGDLRIFVLDIPQNRDARPGPVCRGVPVSIVGLSPWGDRITIQSTCGAASFHVAFGQWWRPGPEARAALERLLGLDEGQ